MPTLSALYSYPIKSIQGVSHRSCPVHDRGLWLDRRWMLIDQNNNFITQRTEERMALFQTRLHQNHIELEFDGEQKRVPFEKHSNKSLEVVIWSDRCKAYLVDPELDSWFSSILGRSCRLVYMPESTKRLVEKQENNSEHITGFSDAYPFLIISEQSLEDLNSRLPNAISMKRFRPNLVVDANRAFEEDSWKTIKIGEVVFDLVKPCKRCVLTTVNPETGEKGEEPLKTLSSYRKINNEILFGQNAVQRNNGQIHVGDQIEILA